MEVDDVWKDLMSFEKGEKGKMEERWVESGRKMKKDLEI